MILITTSDYLPQLGGLSSFTNNLTTTLSEMGLAYEIFHWKNIDDIKNFSEIKLANYELIINVHVMFAWIKNLEHEKTINFIHGSEILMTSPNLFKKIFKKLNTRKYHQIMSKCFGNFFISKATLDKCTSTGYQISYSRDFVFHNNINVSFANYIKKNLNESSLVFSSIVRNVPHKNINGVIEFLENARSVLNKEIILYLPKNSNVKSNKITIIELANSGDEERDFAYRNSHFNLLLSLDHSENGFFEGFGLTVLESALYGVPSIVLNTGGLSESVHHEISGWVLENVSIEEILKIKPLFDNLIYQEMQIRCYEHIVSGHSLTGYKRLVSSILNSKKAA